MKPLKPTMREKKRYLLVRGKNLKINIERAIFDFIGILGMSKVGLHWIKESENTAIIAVNREAINEVRASLGVYKEKMSVERVSGTLKGLRKAAKTF